MHQTPSAPSNLTRHTALALLFVIGALSYMDRYILLILVEPIKAELHLTDTQIGLLNGLAFALFYTVLGVPVALLADRVHRVRLVATACFLWSLFTAAGGLANSFLTLAMARMGVGIGEAGSTAPALSILSDYYPPSRRALVIGVFSSSSAVGIFAGSTLAGWVTHAYGWREALFCVGALGLLVSPLFLFLVREPVRGGTDPVVMASQDEPAPPLRATVSLFARSPSLRFLMVGQGLASLVAVGLISWAPAFLMRVQGMSILEMGAWFGLASGLSMGVGIFGGGAIANVFTARSPRAYALVPCGFMLIATPLLVATVLAPTWQWSLLFLLVPKGLSSACNVASMALVQNLAPAKARATASSLLVLVINVFGVAGGPLFVGMISDATASHGVDSLSIGLLSMAPVCLISAAAFYACSRVVTADINRAIDRAELAPASPERTSS